MMLLFSFNFGSSVSIWNFLLGEMQLRSDWRIKAEFLLAEETISLTMVMQHEGMIGLDITYWPKAITPNSKYRKLSK